MNIMRSRKNRETYDPGCQSITGKDESSFYVWALLTYDELEEQSYASYAFLNEEHAIIYKQMNNHGYIQRIEVNPTLPMDNILKEQEKENAKEKELYLKLKAKYDKTI